MIELLLFCINGKILIYILIKIEVITDIFIWHDVTMTLWECLTIRQNILFWWFRTHISPMSSTQCNFLRSTYSTKLNLSCFAKILSFDDMWASMSLHLLKPWREQHLIIVTMINLILCHIDIHFVWFQSLLRRMEILRRPPFSAHIIYQVALTKICMHLKLIREARWLLEHVTGAIFTAHAIVSDWHTRPLRWSKCKLDLTRWYCVIWSLLNIDECRVIFFRNCIVRFKNEFVPSTIGSVLFLHKFTILLLKAAKPSFTGLELRVFGV